MDINDSTVYFRDRFVPFGEAKLSIASAPMLYGLSIYTNFPVFKGADGKEVYIFRLADHFRRLQNSTHVMAFTDFEKDWDAAKFENMVKELLRRNKVRGDSLVRVSVFVDDVLKGTRMHGLKHSLAAFVYPTPQMLPKSGASLCVSSWRRTPDNAIPSRAKVNGSYVNASLMKHEAVQNGFDDAIALDAEGHVAESTVANIFLVRGGSLLTPGVDTDLMEGLTRNTVFSLARELEIPCEERSIDRSELYLADEIFLSGSSVNIVPVTSVDNKPVGKGKPGKVTERISEAYNRLVRGKSGERSDWLTPAPIKG